MRMVNMNDRPLLKRHMVKALIICFWLLLWEILYRIVDNDLLFASPLEVVKTLFHMVRYTEFWKTIGFSFVRIVFGFLLALITGTILAVFSYISLIFRELITPLIKVIKSIPVASFIILALIWLKRTTNLSVLISYMMVIPVIYTNVLQGLINTDSKLLQMTKVFQISIIKKIRAVYITSVLPYFISAVSVGLGFCWKAGIAAEVIATPQGSIGKSLYEAKLYLMTKELFAWTIVIILISVLFEKTVMFLIRTLQHSST
jgi:NitT/TauT family transport system permease protein